jgi:xanthine dehydrogenase YagR molybdenum-binding subunit
MGKGFSRRGFLRTGLVAGAGASLLGRAAPADAAATPAGAADHERVQVRTHVNGQPRSLDVDPDDSALGSIRGLGLTGCKQGCGHGACGACAVLLNGTPVATCLLPTTALEGAQVTTVEGLDGDPLHPIQKAFVAQDALQCGFCTPGFVVEAVAFHDRWRAENGTAAPSRDQVSAALAGHLCRCGAYAAIHRAVSEACQGLHDGPMPVAPRYDAVDKVTGAAVYTVDVQLPDQVQAYLLRSGPGSARVISMDLSAAKAMPRVLAVKPLVREGSLIRFGGQELAVVVAEDPHVARAALDAVVVHLEQRPAVTSIAAGLAADAPLVFADDDAFAQEGHNAAEVGGGGAIKLDRNVRGPTAVNLLSSPRKARQRVVDAGDQALSLRLSTAVVPHSTLEPHACLASWRADGGLDLYVSTQSVDYVAGDVAEVFDVLEDQVRVVANYVGGGFGAKVGLQLETKLAIELAQELARPVLVALDRAGDIASGGNRPGTVQEIQGALDAAGDLTAMTAQVWSDSGVAVGHAVVPFMRFLYPDAERDVVDWEVVTHGGPGLPFRAPGGPQAMFGIESLAEQAAARLGEDPLSLRRRWDPNPNRQRLYDWIETLPAWQARRTGADTGRFRRGLGMASGVWAIWHDPDTEVEVTASADGFVLRSACQDMGNGSRSTAWWELARQLGVDRSLVQVHFGENTGPHGPISAGSRTTPSLAPAIEDAVRQIQEVLLARAEGLGLQGGTAGQGGVLHSNGFMSWQELAGQGAKVTVVGRRKLDRGQYIAPITVAGIRMIRDVSASVCVMDVLVDTRLGKTQVLEAWSGLCVGRIVCPPVATSQVEGAVIQGVSMALYEERRLCPATGALLSRDLETQRLTGIGDTPLINVHFDEQGFEHLEGGLVGLAELAKCAPPAAVANAVFHATGRAPTSLPIRPDLLVEAP